MFDKSTSFLIARKNRPLSEAQRNAIADLVEESLLGEPVTPESCDGLCEEYGANPETVRELLAAGWTPQLGDLNRDDGLHTWGDLVSSILDVIQAADPESFRIISKELNV